MSSNAFQGQGRRLGSYNDSQSADKSNPNVNSSNRLWPIDTAVQFPSGLQTQKVHPTTKEDLVEIPSLASSSLLATTHMQQHPHEGTDRKRKRRASTASTASLPSSISTSPSLGIIVPPVSKRLKGEEIISLLTDKDRECWNDWVEREASHVDPLESLETWYHDIRNSKFATSPRLEGSQDVRPLIRVSDTRIPANNETHLRADLPSELTPPRPSTSLLTELSTTSSMKGTLNAAPGSFRTPTVLKTWCHGYVRHRDIKLEEVLQRNHLSYAVVSSFVWDMDFWWSKINSSSTPCQLIIQRNQVQQGTKLHDGPNRIILHPENTKILHSKFMLLYYEEAKELRLVITSANMVGFDWGEKGGFMENVVFLVDLAKISSKEDQGLTQFGADLSEYCSSLGLSNNIVDQFKNYNWKPTRDLIFVGTHGRVSEKQLPYTGLAGLASKLSEADLAHDGELEIDYVASSIGKLNWEFLSSLYLACKGQQPLLSPSKCKVKVSPEELLRNIRVYFASQNTADVSKGGTANATTLCFYPSNYYSLGEEQKVFYDCKSRRSGGLLHSKILFVRPKEIKEPEVLKSPAQSSAIASLVPGHKDHGTASSTPEALTRRSPTPWVYIGSANCSWAAWCNPRNIKKEEDEFNTGSNWECGVIIPVRVLQSGLGRLDVFSNIVPIPMHTDTEQLHPQSRKPFFDRPAPSSGWQPPKGLT